MKMKLKKLLRIEKITIFVLIGISIFSFLLSLFIEYILPIFVAEEILKSFHSDYLVNVVLSVLGSSIISFMAIIFPYINKKKQQYNNILEKIKNVYHAYSNLYAYFVVKSNKSDLSEDIEIFVPQKVNEVNNSINIMVTEYRNMDFTMDVIDEIIDILENKISVILVVIINSVNFLSTLSKIREDENQQKDFQFVDYINKCAESEYYSYIVKEIDDIYSFDKFNKLCSSLFITWQVINRDICSRLGELEAEIEDNNKQKIVFAHTLKTNIGLKDIYSKYEIKYVDECDNVNEQFKNILNRAKENGVEKFEHWHLHSDMKEALNAGDFEKAKKILKEIEDLLIP